MNFCGDCGVTEGEFHLENCDQEICPVCKKQRLMCIHLTGGCNIDGFKREPFILPSVIACARCGSLYPELWMVSNDEWKKTCGLTYQLEDVLCWDCFNEVRKIRKLPKIKKEVKK